MCPRSARWRGRSCGAFAAGNATSGKGGPHARRLLHLGPAGHVPVVQECPGLRQPNLNPALCYPAATVDDIKDLPLRALLDRHVVGRRPQRDCARIARVDDLPAEPTTPHSEVVNASPREPEVDRDGKGALAEDSDEGWRLIQRVLDGSAWDDPDRSGM